MDNRHVVIELEEKKKTFSSELQLKMINKNIDSIIVELSTLMLIFDQLEETPDMKKKREAIAKFFLILTSLFTVSWVALVATSYCLEKSDTKNDIDQSSNASNWLGLITGIFYYLTSGAITEQSINWLVRNYYLSNENMQHYEKLLFLLNHFLEQTEEYEECIHSNKSLSYDAYQHIKHSISQAYTKLNDKNKICAVDANSQLQTIRFAVGHARKYYTPTLFIESSQTKPTVSQEEKRDWHQLK